MSIGSVTRRILGRRLFKVVGAVYRRVFVDLVEVVRTFPALPPASDVLDIGGGDGQVVNLLLARFPSIRVTMIDLATNIGTAVEARYQDRVRVLPGTSLRAFGQTSAVKPEVFILSDVLHHIPRAQRPAFFEELAEVVGQRSATLIVKEVLPGGARSRLALLADHYISGDRNVTFLARDEVVDLVRARFPRSPVQETGLFEADAPNYSLVFSLNGAPA